MQRQPTRWYPWRRTGLPSQVREDLLDDRRFQDRRDDLQLTAAVRAVLQVEIEDALEQPGPTEPHRAAVRAVRFAGGGYRRLGGRHRIVWNHLGAQLGVGCCYDPR